MRPRRRAPVVAQVQVELRVRDEQPAPGHHDQRSAFAVARVSRGRGSAPEGRGVLLVGRDGPPGGLSDRDGRRAVLSLALDREVQACLDVAQEPLVLRLLLQNPLWL